LETYCAVNLVLHLVNGKEWNVWVVKPNGITNRQLSNGSYKGQGNISAKYFAVVPTSVS
jgi:hypothetical protein